MPVAFFNREDGGFNVAWRHDNLRSNFDSMGPDRGEVGEDEDRGFGGSTARDDGRLMGEEEEPFESAFAS